MAVCTSDKSDTQRRKDTSNKDLCIHFAEIAKLLYVQKNSCDRTNLLQEFSFCAYIFIVIFNPHTNLLHEFQTLQALPEPLSTDFQVLSPCLLPS